MGQLFSGVTPGVSVQRLSLSPSVTLRRLVVCPRGASRNAVSRCHINLLGLLANLQLFVGGVSSSVHPVPQQFEHASGRAVNSAGQRGQLTWRIEHAMVKGQLDAS